MVIKPLVLSYFLVIVDKAVRRLYIFEPAPGFAARVLSSTTEEIIKCQPPFTNGYEKNPKFDELVTKRSRFAWLLTALVLGIYFVFIMVVAFNPTLLATPIWEGVKPPSPGPSARA